MPHNLKLKKIKMPDMGEKMAMPSMIPMFHVDYKQMPEIEHWEVGKKYKLVVEVEMKSKHEDKEMVSGGFEIMAYKHLKEKSINDMDDKEFGDYQGEQLAKH